MNSIIYQIFVWLLVAVILLLYSKILEYRSKIKQLQTELSQCRLESRAITQNPAPTASRTGGRDEARRNLKKRDI